MTEPWPDDLEPLPYKAPTVRPFIAAGPTYVVDWAVQCCGDGGKCATPAAYYAVWHPVGSCSGLRMRMREAMFCTQHLKRIEVWSERVIHKPWFVRWLYEGRCRCGRSLQLPTDVLTLVVSV